MTDLQFWVFALIGTTACMLLALLVKREREMPPQVSNTSDVISPTSHNHFIYGVKLNNTQWERVEELRNWQHDSANHERMKWWLSQGPDHGIEWQDGHIEPGSASEIKLAD